MNKLTASVVCIDAGRVTSYLTAHRLGSLAVLLSDGGDLASTGVRDRGTRAEAHVLVNPVEKQRNCERRLRSRCLNTSERST